MAKAQERNCRDFNARHLDGPAYSFAIGEGVYVRASKDRKNKLSPPFQGPYCLRAFKGNDKKTALLDVPGKGVRQRGVKFLVLASVLPEPQRQEAERAQDLDMAGMWR